MGVRVPVDPDEPGLGAGLQHGDGVARQAEGAVDIDGAGVLERGAEELDNAVTHDRIVNVFVALHVYRPLS